MRSLIYVSNNCIGRDCKAHPFFEQEKEILLSKFGDFYAISSAGFFKISSDGIQAQHLTNKKDRVFSWFRAINYDLFSEFYHMLTDKKFTPKRFIKLFRFTKRGMMLERFIEKVVEKDTFLYSYWISYDGYAVARQKRKHPEYKTMARAHAFDIQLNRNDVNPYLMKRVICKHIDRIAFISNDGYQDFLSYYEKEQENFSVCYLGSQEKLSGFVERKDRGKITVVTCSSVVKIKRIHLMIDALKNWSHGKIEWVHIGDGELFNDIRQKAEKELSPNPNVDFEFMGRLANEEVSRVLKREDVNLFVNCSEMEGVPVSIMEAMSTGLPVIAPRVGGIPELVTTGCGMLFEKDRLYDALVEFAELSVEEKKKYGINAYEVWKEKFCLENNDEALFKDV